MGVVEIFAEQLALRGGVVLLRVTFYDVMICGRLVFEKIGDNYESGFLVEANQSRLNTVFEGFPEAFFR